MKNEIKNYFSDINKNLKDVINTLNVIKMDMKNIDKMGVNYDLSALKDVEEIQRIINNLTNYNLMKFKEGVNKNE